MFWDPGVAHGFDDLFSPLQVNRIVALRAGAVTADGEPGIEGKPGLDFGSRFVESTKLHQSNSQHETSGRIVWVQFLGPAIQVERLLVGTKMKLGDGDIGYPKTGFRIVRTDAQRLKFMALSFLGMTVEQFCETNQRVSRSL